MPKTTLEQNFVEYLQDVGPNSRYEKIFRAVILDVWQSNYKLLDAENELVRNEIKQLEADRQRVFDLHMSNTYSNEEFLDQKDRINQRINERKFLLQEKQVEEFDMEVALDFCFRYIRDGGKTWQELEEFPAFRARFQKNVFPIKVNFNGEKFGTKKIAMIYKLRKESGEKISNLVPRVRGRRVRAVTT
jgi:hypothetical protein